MMTIKTNQEYASLVPQLSKEEYESLKQSIKENGLWVPIVVNNDGVILDGHHRYKACQELGVKIEPYKMVRKEDFADKLHEKMFVIDCNLTRRQLNNFQRTELALKSKSILEEIVKQNESQGGKGDRNLTPLGRVDEQIGQRAGVSRDTVRKVEKIAEKASEEVKQSLRAGQMSINEAIKQINEKDQWLQIEKELQKLKLKLGNAIKELHKADKKFDELSREQLNRPKLTEEQLANMSKHEREAPIRELLDLFSKKLEKYLDVCKASASMKFFIKYRIEQNNNIEFVISETLKEMEQLNLDKENISGSGGVRFWARRAIEAILLAAAAENNIADGPKYIKNSEMIQNQLQMLTQ
jgi:ParB-like chromosome segregation protein Spo0J